MDLEQIKQRIAEGKLDAVEDAWMAAMEQRAPLEEMRAALAALTEAEQGEAAQTLAWMFLSERMEQDAPPEALDAARAVLPAVEANPDLRKTTVELYRTVHGQGEHFEDILRASGLGDNQSLRRAIRTMDVCLACRPGCYLANRFDNQVARIEQFDPALGEYVLIAQDGRRTELEPKLLADEFEVVPDTDFRVLCRFRTDELGQYLQKDLAAVLTGVCMARGGEISSTDLKDLLVPRYIPANKWSGWWNRARTASKRSDQLSLEGRNPTMVCYHPGGRTLEEELAADVEEARTAMDFLPILTHYARETRGRKVPVRDAFLGPVLATLIRQIETFRERNPADAVIAALVLDRAVEMGLPAPAGGYPTAAQLLAESDQPADVIASLTDTSLWPAALEGLAGREDAADHLERLLTLAPANQLDPIASRLRALGCGEAVDRAVAEALARPGDFLQITMWLWQGPAEPVPGADNPLTMLSNVLGVMQQMQRDGDVGHSDRKEAYRQIRASLTADGCKRFRAALVGVDPAVAATIKNRVERSEVMSPSSRHELLAVLREEFYGLFAQEKVEPWLDESVVWSSQAAFARQEEVVKDLVEVKLPAAARAIGAAAALGDLSENSEWENAVEEQRRLNDRMLQLQADLVKTRVLSPHDVPETNVGIGSRVVLRKVDDGTEVTLSFLGPWDTDIPGRVYSYKTPLALTLMGRQVGEQLVVRIDSVESEYVIERLESAVDSAGPQQT